MKLQAPLRLVAILFSLAAAQLHAQMVIIASPELKIASISKNDVRDIFTGATADLRSGTHVKPVLLKKGPVQDEFLVTFIGVKETQFRSDWVSLLFAGKMFLPPTLDLETDVVDFVAHHPSSIGYIHKATPHKGVVVLTVK
jgi:hypothetical protein